MSKLRYMLPGLPGDDGRATWHPVLFDYVPGKTLADYLRDDLHLTAETTSHVVIAGGVVRPEEFATFVPPMGAEIAVVPTVEGSKQSVILGALGFVVGMFVPGLGLAASPLMSALAGAAIGSTIGTLITPRPRAIKDQEGPSSYLWNGIGNDGRAGVPEPILLGERLVGGVRIGAFRRRGRVVGPRTAGSPSDGVPQASSEKLYLLLLVAGHATQGPVGITSPNAAPNTTTNKPDVRINGTHYANYPGVDVEWRTGSALQPVITGFDVVANTYDLAVNLTELGMSVPYTYTTASDEVDAFEVLFTLPGLSHADDKGIKDNTTSYVLEYRKVGDPGWTNVDYDGARTLKAKSRSVLTETRRVEGLPKGRYEIKVAWLSAAHTDVAKDQWHLVLSGVTEETQENLTYEGRSLLAVKGIATEQLNGPMPVVTSVWRGYIPAKFNGSAFDAPSWGVGTTAPAGRNPHWLALSLLRDGDIGAGNEIADSDIDLPSWKAAADYADELETVQIEGGATYTEPRFQFDAYIDQDQDALDLVQQILGTCRSAIILSSNQFRVGVDRPGLISQVFGMGNIKADSMQLSFKSERAEVNSFEATFDDAAADWETESHIESIDNRDLPLGGTFCDEADLVANGLPVLRRRMSLWGVTRRTQAARELRFALRQIYALRESGSFGASKDAVLAETYDLVGLSHDLSQWGWSGRVRAGQDFTGTPYENRSVMFDRTVPYEVGTTYEVMVRFSDGDSGSELIETRTVDALTAPEDGEYFGVITTAPFSRPPAEGDWWAYGPASAVVRPARIVEISRDADDQREIGWAEYNESIYDLAGPIRIPNYSSLPNFLAPPSPLRDFQVTPEIVLQGDGQRVTNLILRVTPGDPGRKTGPFRGCRFEYSYDQTAWDVINTVEGVEYRWTNAPQGATIYVRAIPFSSGGAYNYTSLIVRTVTVPSFAEAAPVVQSVAVTQAEGAYIITWADLGPEFEYEVRTSNPSNWTSDQTGFLARVRATKAVDDSPDARARTYYVRARDRFGNYSSAAAFASINDTAPAAPSITTITRFKDGFKLKVTPPAGVTDIVAIHLHAAQSASFVPSAANRAANVVGAQGGEFFFKTGTAGAWYFKATCEDWLSERMNDWIYSAEDDDTILVIQPVDPANVALVAPQTGNVGGGFGSDNKVYPRRERQPRVSWDHTDAVNPANSLIGFEVIIYVSDPQKPAFTATTSDPDQRLLWIDSIDVLPATYIAAVKALYVDGLTSDLVTSSGLTIPQDSNPALRDGDDRNVIPYGESFTGVALPTGFSIVGATHSLTGIGELIMTRTGADWRLVWDVNAWADAYLDTKFRGAMNVMIRFLSEVPGQVSGFVAISGHTGAAAVSAIELPFIDDGYHHTYRVPFGILNGTGSPQVTLDLSASGIPNASSVRVTAIALASESFDIELDGHFDRAVKARDQFGKDAAGGYFVKSPLRNTDDDGNVVLVDKNGLWFLEVDGVTEGVYRRGRRATINGTDNLLYYWDDPNNDAGGQPTITPPLPQPFAANKVKFWLEQTQRDDTGTTTPHRRYLEITDVDDAGFRLNAMILSQTGGAITPAQYRFFAPSGGWTAANSNTTAQSEMSLETSYDPTVNAGLDAYWRVSRDSAGVRVWPSVQQAYYRAVVWIEAKAPLVKRSNGSYYWMDLTLYVAVGAEAAPHPSALTLSGASQRGPITMRILTDGKAYRFPVVLSPAGVSANNYAVKCEWTAVTREAGYSDAPTYVRLIGVELSRVGNSTASSITSELFNVIMVEDF